MNIFCLEQNYFTQKPEQLNEVTGEPVIFMKPQNSLLQQGTPFVYPEFAHELYCGCELILRVSKNGKNVAKEIALSYYDSISVGINFTAFYKPGESDEEELSWEKAKTWNNSSAEGLWMPAADFHNKKDINFCLYQNRALVQLGNSGLMVHNFDAIISAISKSYPLNTGDLIFTGTPAGIGKLMPGDKLEAFIEDDSVLEFEIEELIS